MKTERTHPPLPGSSAPHAASDDASTRDRVARSILEHGASTASALGERLGLTSAAIRRHLSVLLEEGHVVSREQRIYGQRGRGRPSQVYALTDAGRAHFYQAYDRLAIDALHSLLHVAGPAALDAVAADRVRTVAARFTELRATQPDANPVDLLATALTDDGYVASVVPALHGDQLCQHHCPIAHVAVEFPQLCEVETRVFSELLGSQVQRLATIAHGDGVCTTHVSRLDAPPDATRRQGIDDTTPQEDR